MQGHRRALMLVAGAALAASVGMPAAHAQKKTVTIGTAGLMGVYFPLGGALCRIVNATRKEHKLRCSVEPTEGSVSNIKGVLAGDFDLGFAQSDAQYYALKGEGPFKDKPQPKLRALFTVYPEVFTLMARQDANIKTFEDIKGKRVSIGSPGSGTRATMELVMKAYGIKRSDLKSTAELKFIELAPALCDSKIDAFVFVAGHPNEVLHDAATSCATSIAAVAGAPIDELVASQPFYAKADIPAKMYKGTDAARPSFGMVATVVVSADMPDATAYAITRAVFENFGDFKKLHPAVANITKEGSLRGDTAPFHPGAVKYFKEAGLM
jgi:TRAP transporter TAXI family solute receptor